MDPDAYEQLVDLLRPGELSRMGGLIRELQDEARLRGDLMPIAEEGVANIVLVDLRAGHSFERGLKHARARGLASLEAARRAAP